MELILIGKGSAPRTIDQEMLARIFERARGNGWEKEHYQEDGRTLEECFLPYFSGKRVGEEDARGMIEALDATGWTPAELTCVAWSGAMAGTDSKSNREPPRTCSRLIR